MDGCPGSHRFDCPFLDAFKDLNVIIVESWNEIIKNVGGGKARSKGGKINPSGHPLRGHDANVTEVALGGQKPLVAIPTRAPRVPAPFSCWGCEQWQEAPRYRFGLRAPAAGTLQCI